MRYIELKPLRAGKSDDPSLYAWSSYFANALGLSNELFIQHSLYRQLGRDAPSRQPSYRDLCLASVGDEDLQAIRESSNNGWVLGNDRVREEIEKLPGRRTAPKPRGRPKNKD